MKDQKMSRSCKKHDYCMPISEWIFYYMTTKGEKLRKRKRDKSNAISKKSFQVDVNKKSHFWPKKSHFFVFACFHYSTLFLASCKQQNSWDWGPDHMWLGKYLTRSLFLTRSGWKIWYDLFILILAISECAVFTHRQGQ